MCIEKRGKMGKTDFCQKDLEDNYESEKQRIRYTKV